VDGIRGRRRKKKSFDPDEARAFATGSLGMTTEQYNNELPRNYFLRVQGYNDKIIEERRFARMQTFFSLLPHVNKSFTFSDMMKALPLPGDEVKKQGKKIITKEMLEEMRMKHAKFKPVQNNNNNKRSL
jgi:hypothetical protein